MRRGPENSPFASVPDMYPQGQKIETHTVFERFSAFCHSESSSERGSKIYAQFEGCVGSEVRKVGQWQHAKKNLSSK